VLASIASEALVGLESHAVDVEADVVAAAPAFTIVGLPDAAVQESRERVRAAIVNSSYDFPRGIASISRPRTAKRAVVDPPSRLPSCWPRVRRGLVPAGGRVSLGSTLRAAGRRPRWPRAHDRGVDALRCQAMP
jgi:hypothetical protein